MVLDDVAASSGYLDKVFESNKELVYSDDGHIYCFPYAGNEYVLWYYNKALFEQYELEVPTTYEELLHCVEVFSDNGITPMALFGQEGWITTAMYDAIATRYVADGIKGLDTKTTAITDEGKMPRGTSYDFNASHDDADCLQNCRKYGCRRCGYGREPRAGGKPDA